jgi:hypothetical protein
MTTRATTVVLALAIAASGAALGAVLLLSSSSKGGSATPPVSGSTVPPGPSVGSPPAGLLFDVTHYNGCTGNGVADCTVGIQAAIVAAQAKGSGSVWFPAGHYLVAGSGSADSLVVAAGAPVTLAGAGRDLSYIVERTKKRDLISIKANHTITQDLTFDTATNDGGHAWGSSADFTTLRRCRVVGGTNQYAARFTNSGAGATPEKPTYRIGNVVDDPSSSTALPVGTLAWTSTSK